MGTAQTWTHADTNGYGGSVQVAEFHLVADANGMDSAITEEELVGEVVKIEVDPNVALNPTATLKGYEYGTKLATATRDHWMNYIIPGTAVEVVYYPLVESSATNANGALTTKLSQRRVVCARQELDLAGALMDVAGTNSVVVRLYVRQ